MTRGDFEALVFDAYNIRADYPFDEDLVTGVFRHTGSGKWFAIAMNISGSRLGRESGEHIDVVNMKCAPEVIESLVGVERGIYRAYHMNKMHWLTVDLAECDTGTVSWLLAISFELTGERGRGRSRKGGGGKV